MQMYMTLDALADGGVYAGVPKEKAVNLIAHTMMVCIQRLTNTIWSDTFLL